MIPRRFRGGEGSHPSLRRPPGVALPRTRPSSRCDGGDPGPWGGTLGLAVAFPDAIPGLVQSLERLPEAARVVSCGGAV